MSRIALKTIGSIPNHKLQKNLSLNGNYISNDGDSEAISITDDGLTGFSKTSPSAKVHIDAIDNNLNCLKLETGDNPLTNGSLLIGVNNNDSWLFNISNKGKSYTAGYYLGQVGSESGQFYYSTDVILNANSDKLSLRGENGISFFSNRVEKATLDSSGNVGIGVSDPDTTLEVWSASTQFKLSYDDLSFATLNVTDNSNLTIATGETGDLTLDAEKLILDANNIVAFKDNGTQYFSISRLAGDRANLSSSGGSGMKVSTTAGDIILDCAANKEIIINENGGTYTPTADDHVTNKKYVDDQTQYQYHFIKIGVNYSYVGGTRVFLPTPGAEYVRELPTAPGGPENFTWICPYDGTLERVQARSEEVCGSSIIGFWHTSDAIEVPGPAPTSEVTVNMSVDDTTYEFDFTGETNTFSKGDIIMFSFDPTNDANDVHFMITLKLDVTT